MDGGGHNSYSLWDDYPGLSRMIIVHYLWAGVSVQTGSAFPPFYQLDMSICLAGEAEVCVTEGWEEKIFLGVRN